MKLNGAYEIRDVETIERLDALVTNEKVVQRLLCKVKSAKISNSDKLGKPRQMITKVIMEVGKNHHLLQRKMMMPDPSDRKRV